MGHKLAFILKDKDLHLFLAEENIVHCLVSEYCKNLFVRTSVVIHTQTENNLLFMLFQ